MATTVTKNKENKLLKFKTYTAEIDGKDHLVAQVDHVDEKLNIKAVGYRYVIENGTEESFHKTLRKDAARGNNLVTSHSTNPEWNPENYTLNLE